MTTLALGWQLLRTRGFDLGLRATIASLYISGIYFLVQHGPEWAAKTLHTVVSALLMPLVVFIFVGGFIGLFMSLSRPLKQLRRWIVRYVLAFSILTIINIVVLMIHIGAAIFSKDDFLPKIMESVAHFIERESDFFFRNPR